MFSRTSHTPLWVRLTSALAADLVRRGGEIVRAMSMAIDPPKPSTMLRLSASPSPDPSRGAPGWRGARPR